MVEPESLGRTGAALHGPARLGHAGLLQPVGQAARPTEQVHQPAIGDTTLCKINMLTVIFTFMLILTINATVL